ncbi:MAG: pyridoxamine 5'-phosphate oxidase family protein [Candidatus Paceibacterota bacterium]|nr:pyridoxamine 5'-phosphate oxidase family protein [Candidatus Nomurabacteria bacterium]
MEKSVIDFLKNNSLCILSTCKDNKPHSVPVYYFYDDENETFYIATKAKTQKVLNILENKNTFITVFRTDPQATFTAECEATIIDHTNEDFPDIAKRLMEIHSAQSSFPTPLSMIKDGSLVLIQLKVITHKFNSYRQTV